MKTVLIVDDVQTDRELMAQVVSKAGHHVEHAADGDEAVEKAKALKPALILLDVVMPKLDGFGACRKLKKDAETVGHPDRARHLQGDRHRQVLGPEAGLRRLPGEAVHAGRAVARRPQVPLRDLDTWWKAGRRRVTRPLPGREAARYCVFALGSRSYALPAAVVIEVASTERLLTVPLTPRLDPGRPQPPRTPADGGRPRARAGRRGHAVRAATRSRCWWCAWAARSSRSPSTGSRASRATRASRRSRPRASSSTRRSPA